MKKIIGTIGILAIGYTAAYTQATPVLDKVANATCDCLTKQKDNIKTMADIQKMAGTCIMQNSMDKMTALQKEMKIKVLNEQSGKKIGEAIGFKVAKECPIILEKVMSFNEIKTTDQNQVAATEKSNFTGEIVKVETEDYTYIHIKNEAGRVTKFLWLEYFKGSDAYRQNPQLLVGKKVDIQWQQIEIYNAKLNDYMDAKEIRELSLQK